MSIASSTYDTLVSSVADRYRRDGYEVLIEPDPKAIPFDLGGYRPDLVARKGDLSLIVEIKAKADKASFDQLRSLVDETKRHQGWRFVLVTGQDISGSDLGIESEGQVTWEEIARDVEHAGQLSSAGESKAAYLFLWIAFEKMMRNQALSIDLPLERLSPSILIRQLYSQGELTMAQFDTALDCQKLRNQVVHGFSSPDLTTGLKTLRAIVKDLLPQWSSQALNMETLTVIS